MPPRWSFSILFAASLGLAITSSGVRAQADPPASISARIEEAGRALALSESSVQALDPARRREVVEFVIGNTLFTLTHELGHAVISLFGLPVLGREEDAADTFATLALLHVGTEFTHGVLLDAARGLLLMAAREARMGQPPVFFAEHGLDRQRAFQIICLMTGSDPRSFRAVASRAGIPPDRQETCIDEFRQSEQSWLSLLRPHLRSSAPRARSFLRRLLRLPAGSAAQDQIQVRYRDAPAPLAPYRQVLVSVGLLETVSSFASQNLDLSGNLALEARSCGEANAYWDRGERRVVVCYELVAEYAEVARQAAP
ncbi:MAG: hypothetical protein K0Q60_1705 [Microvirga sp.]|jgi:hypothetical protein|nr:hypothetical protein [Microvirga sp.]